MSDKQILKGIFSQRERCSICGLGPREGRKIKIVKGRRFCESHSREVS